MTAPEPAGTVLVDVYVPGRPVPQGSVIPIVTPAGHARATYRKPVSEYRLRLAQAIRGDAPVFRYDGPVLVEITIELERPKAHYRTGRNAHLLRDTAPTHPTGHNTGDVDKYARLCLDACTDAAVWLDDAQAVLVVVGKLWAPMAALRLHVETIRESQP